MIVFVCHMNMISMAAICDSEDQRILTVGKTLFLKDVRSASFSDEVFIAKWLLIFHQFTWKDGIKSLLFCCWMSLVLNVSSCV